MSDPFPPAAPTPLELTGADMWAMVDRAMEHIASHVDSLPNQPAADVDGGAALARSLVEPLPEHGTDFDTLLALLFDRVIPKSFNTASPGYLGYIPGGGLLHTAIADLIANAVNRYVGVWLAAPGLVQLETNVVRWLCEIVGYPEQAGGVLTTGGSLANLIALTTARRERLPANFLAGTIYTSEQTHHSVEKAAVLAGFPAANVRRVACDATFRMELTDLRRRIAEDRDLGLTPFLVAGSAGTTNTGAVDDLSGIANIAREEGLWFHLDAAYGGFFALTERGRRLLTGLERADSMALDPHKGLFLPYGNGSLLVRDPGALRRTHSTCADYMPTLQNDDDLVDFTELSPELSRDFRGLRVWLPIKMHGIDVFRRQLDEKLDLTAWVTEELREIPHVEIVAEPQLSIVAFRLHPPHVSTADLNDTNRELLRRVNARQRVYLTATTVDERFVLRICVLSFRTHRDRLGMAVSDIRAACEEICASGSARSSEAV